MVTNKIIAVIGPTGSGKTALGEAIAQRFSGEIVSADSKQVYRGMDIGTAKERNLAVPQHLIDIKNPGEKITVAEYQALAYEVIDALLTQKKLPVLVGSGMLYAESVLNGYIFAGKGKKQQKPRYQSLKIGIALERELLKERLQKRTQQWLDQGLVEEITHLLDAGVSAAWLHQCGQEYRYFSEYVLGKLSLEEAINLTNISLNQYVKRQYTWWRRHSDVLWVADFAEALPHIHEFLFGEGML